MHAQDLFAPVYVGVRHHDLAVETAGPQQGGVKHVRTVGGGDQDDALVGLEAVHLNQHLVQGLLTLVVAAAEAGTAMPPDRVDFVDKDDAGGVLLALLEHVADAAGADTDEHFHEVGPRDGEERHIGFAGDGTGQQRLTSAGRPHQQHALGDLATQALELLRVLQEFDDFLKFAFSFIDAGDILERHASLFFRQQPRSTFAKAHRPAAARLHLAHEEHPDADQQQHREPGQQVMQQRIDAVVLRLGDHPNILVRQCLDQRRVFRRVGLEGAPIVELAGNGSSLDHNITNAAAIHLGDEVRVGDLRGVGVAYTGLEQVE